MRWCLDGESRVCLWSSMSSPVDRLIRKVRAWARRTKTPKATMAKRCGLSPQALVGMDRPKWNPTARTLRLLNELMAPPRRKKAKR